MLTPQEMELYQKLDELTIKDYKDVFDIFDESGDGKISNNEITKVMHGLGENPDPSRVEELIILVDYNKDGYVDFQEFLCLMVKFLFVSDQAEEELVTVFKQFDKDNDGEINALDLMTKMNELGYEYT